MKQPEGLIEVLLDKKAREDERDDAAMDLCAYDDNEALNALVSVAMDKNEDLMVVDSCGESIAQIWTRRNFFDHKIFSKVHPQARFSIFEYIKYYKPEWIKTYHLDKDKFED